MSLKDRAVIETLRMLPRNWISATVGKMASVRLPGPMAKMAVTSFGKAVGVDFDEVREPLSSFDSVQSFFVRELAPGARTIDEDEAAVVSPCDGAWGAAGKIEDGTIFQVKGITYQVAELLKDADVAKTFEGGTFATLYLSPRDYHRFHFPVDGKIVRADAVPGTLWPVNRAGVTLVDGLFSQNERIIAYVDVRGDRAPDLAMVAVGATCVGKIKVTFDDLETNIGGDLVVREYDDPPTFTRGEEWGRFLFGSTIVLLMRPEVGELFAQPEGTRVRMGQRVGTLCLAFSSS